MTPHLFVLGPSGAGKSFVAASVAQQRGYLHIELDGTSRTPPRDRPSLASRIRTRLELSIDGAEFEAVSFGGLSRPWRRLLAGDASALANELRRRSDRAGATACIVSFPSGVALSARQIALVENAGMKVRILYGNRDDCVRAFLAREAATGRGLQREHWDSHNAETYEAFGKPEFDRYRVPAFGEDGSRLPIDQLLSAVCG